MLTANTRIVNRKPVIVDCKIGFSIFFFITLTRLYKTLRYFQLKNDDLPSKNIDFFLFLLKHRLSVHVRAYTSTHNLRFRAKLGKKMYTLLNPSFTIYKWVKGGHIIYTDVLSWCKIFDCWDCQPIVHFASHMLKKLYF